MQPVPLKHTNKEMNSLSYTPEQSNEKGRVLIPARLQLTIPYCTWRKGQAHDDIWDLCALSVSFCRGEKCTPLEKKLSAEGAKKKKCKRKKEFQEWREWNKKTFKPRNNPTPPRNNGALSLAIKPTFRWGRPDATDSVSPVVLRYSPSHVNDRPGTWDIQLSERLKPASTKTQYPPKMITANQQTCLNF